MTRVWVRTMLLALFAIIASVSVMIRDTRFLLSLLAAAAFFCAGLLYGLARRRKHRERERAELAWIAIEKQIQKLQNEGKDV